MVHNHTTTKLLAGKKVNHFNLCQNQTKITDTSYEDQYTFLYMTSVYKPNHYLTKNLNCT